MSGIDAQHKLRPAVAHVEKSERPSPVTICRSPPLMHSGFITHVWVQGLCHYSLPAAVHLCLILDACLQHYRLGSGPLPLFVTSCSTPLPDSWCMFTTHPSSCRTQAVQVAHMHLSTPVLPLPVAVRLCRTQAVQVVHI